MNTIDNTIPATRRTWPRRLLRFALWSLASLVTLYALAFAAINWWGTRQLEQSVARVKAAGESLDFNAMLPKPIDPATNFCAIEPLDGLTAADETTLSPAPLGARYKAIEDARPKPKTQWKMNKEIPQLGNPITGRLSSDAEFLAKWSVWFRDAMPTPIAPPSDKEASTIRQGMETAYPFLKVAAESAPLRKEAQFTPGLGAKGPVANPMLMRVPHLNPAQMMARTLGQHLITCIQLRDGAAALADIQAMLRLTKASVQEPMLISNLVGMTVLSICNDQIWSCLDVRIFNEQQLVTLQRELADFDLNHSMLVAARAEMAGMYQTMQRFDSIGFGCDALSREMSREPKHMPGLIRYGFGRLIPHGLLRKQCANTLDETLELFIAPLRNRDWKAPYRSTPKQPISTVDLSFSNIWNPQVIGLLTGIGGFGEVDASMGVARKAVTLEAVRRQTLIACALERFYLQNQSYPEKLEALVPKHLVTVPIDLGDDKPMRYRRTSDGRFMLWSIGMDGNDDQGKVTPAKEKGASASYLSRPNYKGDWPWRY